MNKLFLILFVCCTVLSGFSQDVFNSENISKKTLKIVSEIEERGQFLSSSVGFAGIEPEQWRRYLKLKKLCNDIEFFELTNHPSAAVKAYAFYGLLENESLLLMAAIEKNQSDTATIMHQSGCIASTSVLIELVANWTYYKYKDQEFLSKENEQIIDEIRARAKERFIEKE